jgi:hypothetical protein
MRLLSFIDGADGYGTLIANGGGAAALLTGDGREQTARTGERLEDGRARLESDRGAVEISWSPAGPVLELPLGRATVGVHQIVVSSTDEQGEASGPGVAWQLPEGGYTALRTLWATTSKGAVLMLVAARPDGSPEHGDELVTAARIVPGAEPYGYGEPLLSTEYDASGEHRRATLELWAGEEEHMPERGAGSRRTGAALEVGSRTLAAARFDWSLDGVAAVGAYEIIRS